MFFFLFPLLLSALSGLPAAGAPSDSCQPGFQAVGGRPGVVAGGGDLEIRYRAHIREERERLEAMGVKFAGLSGEGRLPFTTHRQRASGDSAQREGIDELWEVVSGAAKPGFRSPQTPALRHPDFQDALNEIHAAGYRFVVDPTLSFPGSRVVGSQPDGEKVIAIRATANWSTLRHEMQHMHFAEFLRPFLPEGAPTVRSGRSIRELLPPSALARYSPGELAEVEKYLRAGAPELAINEHLSGMREMKAIGSWRFLPVGVETYAYTDSFMRSFLEELERQSRLTPAQSQVLREIRQRASSEKAGKVLASGAAAAPFLGYLLYSASHEAFYKASDKDPLVYIGPGYSSR